MILKQGSKEMEKTTKKMNFNILFLGGKERENVSGAGKRKRKKTDGWMGEEAESRWRKRRPKIHESRKGVGSSHVGPVLPHFCG